MILQSKDEFDEVMELDRVTGRYRTLSRKQHSEIMSIRPSGGYSIVNGILVCLYRVDNGLYFRLGEEDYKITDTVTSILVRENGYRLFQLMQNENLLVNFRYRSPLYEVPLNMDPTAFIDEEDFDFFLFVHNVLAQGDRRYRVYNQGWR
ncbi:MAG TPA: hypothetical protein VF088_01435 [Pyrinomonadaceae bacterium]